MPSRVRVVTMRTSELHDIMASMQRGAAFVSVRGCDNIAPLPDCTADGSYRYAPRLRDEQVQIRDRAELHRTLPHEAYKNDDLVGPGRKLVLRTRVAGDMTLEGGGKPRGECREATHVIASAELGAFELRQVWDREPPFGGGTHGYVRLGDGPACETAGDRPPRECDYPLLLELRPVR
jgi:hypothetical protein